MRRDVFLIHASPFRRHYPDQVRWSAQRIRRQSDISSAPLGAPDGSSVASGACETAGVKTRNLIIAAVITGTLILGAFVLQFATDPRFLGG